jgi:hypothetical protein
MTIESECCREDAVAWEPCPPFQELQAENDRLRAALSVPVTVDEIEQIIAIEFRWSKATRDAAERVFNFLSAHCSVRISKALR